jgi:hypothetical protein
LSLSLSLYHYVLNNTLSSINAEEVCIRTFNAVYTYIYIYIYYIKNSHLISTSYSSNCRLKTTPKSGRSESYITTDGQSASGPICLGVRHPSGIRNQFFLITFRRVRVYECGAPSLTRGRSVVYSCCWASPTLSFSSPSPAGFMFIIYCLKFETPPTCIYFSQEEGSLVIPPGTGFYLVIVANPRYIVSARTAILEPQFLL